MKRVVLAVLGAALLAGSAGAATPDQIVNPDWVKKPTGDDLVKVLPVKAFEDGVSGFSSLRCVVDGKGKLIDCQKMADGPLGYGFAEAHLKIAGKFRMKLVDKDGKATPGRQVVSTIYWQVPH